MYRPDSVYTERLHKMYRSKDCMEIIERIKDNVTLRVISTEADDSAY